MGKFKVACKTPAPYDDYNPIQYCISNIIQCVCAKDLSHVHATLAQEKAVLGWLSCGLKQVISYYDLENVNMEVAKAPLNGVDSKLSSLKAAWPDGTAPSPVRAPSAQRALKETGSPSNAL